MALAADSGPPPRRMWPGTPRLANGSGSCSSASSPVGRPATPMAGHPPVSSSTASDMRDARPSRVRACTARGRGSARGPGAPAPAARAGRRPAAAGPAPAAVAAPSGPRGAGAARHARDRSRPPRPAARPPPAGSRDGRTPSPARPSSSESESKKSGAFRFGAAATIGAGKVAAGGRLDDRGGVGNDHGDGSACSGLSSGPVMSDPRHRPILFVSTEVNFR